MLFKYSTLKSSLKKVGEFLKVIFGRVFVNPRKCQCTFCQAARLRRSGVDISLKGLVGRSSVGFYEIRQRSGKRAKDATSSSERVERTTPMPH